ncbi:MAG: ribosome biogenesis GTPase Der [Desulfatiglandales bacterium]|jgi:GTP-binding protein|nr:ribosome biogenesis GTPase Der [Desulfatiglandales bacterium]
MASIIAIVGRPNVGKSTLFNRLSRSRDALVDDQPGLTRDRLYASTHWGDTPLTVIDTGGFDDSNSEPLAKLIREQVVKAIDEAERIIFMVDGRQGITPGDEDIADILRRSQKRTLLAVNKIDGSEHDQLVHDFYGLGLEMVYPLSAAHGYGLKTLMTDVVSELPQLDSEKEDTGRIRVAVLGKPNVGKSSLINRILGFERLLVSELPGTTRDSVDTLFIWQGKEYLLIDTAGIRRKGRVKEKIEKFSMIKALRSLDRCHVAIILLDAAAEIADQDVRICGYAFERGRGLVLGVNKWDLIKKDPERKRLLDEALDRQLKFVSFTPRINLSALTGERVRKLFEKIDLVYGHYARRISTGALNRALIDMIHRKPPPIIGKGRLKFYYATQTDIMPPTFVVFTNRPEKVHFSYKRFMINQLKERFDLNFTPIRLIFRKN